MKACTKCGEVKPPEAFARAAHHRDGLHSHCRACRSEQGRKWREANRAVVRERSQAQYDANRDANLRLVAAYDRKFPERRRAGDALRYAIRTGTVTPWPVCAVPDCTRVNIQGHHADYDNPLGVTWLCAAHHRRLHSDFNLAKQLAEVSQ